MGIKNILEKEIKLKDLAIFLTLTVIPGGFIGYATYIVVRNKLKKRKENEQNSNAKI